MIIYNKRYCSMYFYKMSLSRISWYSIIKSIYAFQSCLCGISSRVRSIKIASLCILESLYTSDTYRAFQQEVRSRLRISRNQIASCLLFPQSALSLPILAESPCSRACLFVILRWLYTCDMSIMIVGKLQQLTG